MAFLHHAISKFESVTVLVQSSLVPAICVYKVRIYSHGIYQPSFWLIFVNCGPWIIDMPSSNQQSVNMFVLHFAFLSKSPIRILRPNLFVCLYSTFGDLNFCQYW